MRVRVRVRIDWFCCGCCGGGRVSAAIKRGAQRSALSEHRCRVRVGGGSGLVCGARALSPRRGDGAHAVNFAHHRLRLSEPGASLRPHARQLIQQLGRARVRGVRAHGKSVDEPLRRGG
jgi:hypothetical protein